MKEKLIWHIARVVVGRLVPAVLLATLAALADVGLLDGALYDAVALALRP